MKKYIVFICFTLICFLVNAQVAIGKPNVSNNSTLLDFGTDNKGIVLSTVSTNPSDAVAGTFIVNSTSQSINMLEGTTWKNLTVNGGFSANPFLNTGADVGNGVIIGANISSKPGVLVLESTTRALILPYVANPHTTIGNNASIGTIVYDTTSDSLALFDGVNWHYWQ